MSPKRRLSDEDLEKRLRQKALISFFDDDVDVNKDVDEHKNVNEDVNNHKHVNEDKHVASDVNVPRDVHQDVHQNVDVDVHVDKNENNSVHNNEHVDSDADVSVGGDVNGSVNGTINSNTDVNVDVPSDKHVDKDVKGDVDGHIDVQVSEHGNVDVLKNVFGQSLDAGLIKKYFKEEKKKKTPKFEDLHTRKTVWLRKDLLELVEKEAEERGVPIAKVVNDAIEIRFRLLANGLLPDEFK